MARLSAAERKALPKSDYAVPEKAPGPGSYPIPDREHAGKAKALAAKNASPAVEKRVDRKADQVLDRGGKSGHHAHGQRMMREIATKRYGHATGE